MEKATGGCFNIMACIGDQPEGGRVEVTEDKGSSEKCRWNFRKKVATEQSNNVVSKTESLSASDNDSTETSDNNLQQPPYSCNPEKATERKPEEDSTNVMINMSNISQTSAVVIQTAVRGFLARKQAEKVNADVVKLQAAMRGHLVRRQAVATLRCVLAVVKMQAIVRQRLSKDEKEKMTNQEGFDVTKVDSKSSKKVISSAKLHSSPSLERLLRNGFARLLLDVTPKTKPIYISCEPEKSESSWKWLERWMAVSVTPPHDSQQQQLNVISEPDDLEEEGSKPLLTPEATFNEKKTIAANFGVQSRILSQVKSFTSVRNDPWMQPMVHDHSSPQLKPHSFSGILPEMDAADSGVHSDDKEKKVAGETQDSENKHSVFGSKKSINPSFAAAMSKFERLTATTPSTSRSTSFNVKSLQGRMDSFKIPADTKSAQNKTPGSINALYSSDTSQPKGDLAKTATDDSSAYKGHQKQKHERTDARPGDAMSKVEQLSASAKTPSMHTQVTQPVNAVQKTTVSDQALIANAKATGTHGTTTSRHTSSINTSRSELDSNLTPKRPKPKPKLTKKKSLPTTSATKGGSSLPSFMQVTESAKAKFHASDSTKSSPEVQGKDSSKQTKKTSPVVLANTKHDSSSRLQRSKSKLQQSLKGDGMNSNPRQNSSEKR